MVLDDLDDNVVVEVVGRWERKVGVGGGGGGEIAEEVEVEVEIAVEIVVVEEVEVKLWWEVVAFVITYSLKKNKKVKYFIKNIYIYIYQIYRLPGFFQNSSTKSS